MLNFLKPMINNFLIFAISIFEEWLIFYEIFFRKIDHNITINGHNLMTNLVKICIITIGAKKMEKS